MNVKELFQLDHRIAIVTGGRGLYGAAIAEGLCEMGATVVVASRNEGACQEYADTLCKQGYEAVGMGVDLGSDSSIETFVKRVIAKYGQIDILVNNAVDRSNLASLKNCSRQILQDSMNTNLNGQMILSQQVLKYMVERKQGNIINISSMRGLDCPHFPFYPEEQQEQPVNYTTEKWAMVGLTKYMAGYYGKHNIRVNCIAPGGYNPALTEAEEKSAFVENYIQHTPLHRWASADDIKGPVAFLASDASAYVTGATLVMDGGWTIW